MAGAQPSLTDLVMAARRTNGSVCTVKLVRDKLSDKHRAELDKLIAAPHTEVPATAIRDGLKSLGHTIKSEVIGRHRRGNCACAK